LINTCEKQIDVIFGESCGNSSCFFPAGGVIIETYNLGADSVHGGIGLSFLRGAAFINHLKKGGMYE